ncbi:MAG: tetratricopeptide repeat protein [Chloroflexota bacterium]
MNIEETISQARELRQNDELEGSQELLLELLAAHPKNPTVLYEVGGAYDVLEEEKEAIPYYSKAISAGLEGDDLQECYICLGMCYRNTGDFETAVSILRKAVEKFPDRNSIKAFLALAEYSDAQEDEAVRILLDLLISTTKDEDILTFADTLDFYKDNLDEVWD